MFHNHGEPHMSTTSTESLIEYTNAEVASLLASYQEYKALSEQIESGVLEKPQFSLFGKPGVMQNLNPIAEARKRLEKIGDSMKFQNPLIWLLYKFEAYKNEPGKEIKTITELVVHCEVDGICHRRIDAINTYLSRSHGCNLTTSAFLDQSLSLRDLAQDSRYLAMCLDLSFQRKWSKHENDPAGKWRNYGFATEQDEDLSCC